MDYERNVFQYFQLKFNINEDSDFLFRIKTKNYEYNYNRDKKATFDEYFNSIKFSYLEIDGSLINNTENQIKINSNDNPVKYL